jgi:hypothetical protein
MPNLSLQRSYGVDIPRRGGCGDGLGEFGSWLQIGYGNLLAVNVELLVKRNNQMLDLAVFEFEYEIVAFDIDDARVPSIGCNRRLAMADGR